MRQECILLSLVPSMDLVHKEEAATSLECLNVSHAREDLSQFLDAVHHGRQLQEPKSGMLCEESSDGGLAAARRPPEQKAR